MKSHKCACFVWIKKGKDKKETCHLIALTKEHQKLILALIQQLHDGKVKAFPDEYGLEYKEKHE
jgi:hypothetical protein